MHRLSRTVLSLALPFLTAYCASGGHAPGPTPNAPAVQDGYVGAGDSVRLFYRMVGAGRDTVVVLHGGPGFTMDYMAADLEPLAARHVLLFYDQRGTGRSSLVADSASLDAQRFAEDLEAVRRHFGLERLTLLAHSWGGGVAALYAGRYPERIGRLLVIDPIPARRTYFIRGREILARRRDSVSQRRLEELQAARLADPGSAAACRAYYTLWFVATFADSAAARRSRGDFCAGTPAALANKVKSVDRYTAASLGDWDWRPALHTVAAPTLVIRGTADFLPIESARDWTSSVPNGRLLLLEGSGHFPYLEVPQRFFSAVEAFLDGSWPAGAVNASPPDR
jgi:proline iminopeptidase